MIIIIAITTTIILWSNCPRGRLTWLVSVGPGETDRRATLNYIIATLNYIIWCGLTKAGFPTTREPHGLARSDGRRPHCVTLILSEFGKCLTPGKKPSVQNIHSRTMLLNFLNPEGSYVTWGKIIILWVENSK